ncbi:MAG: DUF1385 domain-containing protein [Candidatus Nanoarchaeia archaeon]
MGLNVGGQAVIEGVMMKSPNYYSVAVRKPDGRITKKTEEYVSLTQRHRLLGLPFFRGIVSMGEMLRLGIKSLTYSANESADEEEETLSEWAIFVTIFFSMAFAVFLFVVIPYMVPTFIGVSEEETTLFFNTIAGLIKVLIFVGYVYLISYMEDIRRVFQNHGAEHMAVNCYEAGQKLTIQNVKKYFTYHPRCGTSFIVIVLLLMIVLFSLIPSIIQALFPSVMEIESFLKTLILLGVRLMFIPIVAGISYEILKLSANYRGNLLMKAIAYPGKLVQGLTTRQPDDGQIKVAITALKEVLKKESKKASA